MALNKLEIVNLALARLGESPIQSMDEGSATSNVARTMYEGARQSALRDHNWNFALRKEPLARLDASPVDYEYVFALPSECLRVVGVEGNPEYTVRSGRLYTNSSAVYLEYIFDEQDTQRFDSMFTEALTYKLASDFAMAIKGSPDLMSAYSRAYTNLISSISSLSQNEKGTELAENPYLDARF